MGKRKGLIKYKGSNSRVWGKAECRSEKVRKVGYSKKKETL